MERRLFGHGAERILVYGAVIAVFGLGARACAEGAESSRDEVKNFVEDAGYNDPIITDIDKMPFMLGCGEGDLVKYEIDATSANTGRTVSVNVCDGLFKGMTIRD